MNLSARTLLEVGSSQRERSNIRAVEAVVRATMATALTASNVKAVMGIGGSHYNKAFSARALEGYGCWRQEKPD